MLGYNYSLHFILILYFSWFFCFIYSDFENQMRSIDPKTIKCIDPCMGSGHILVYAFDVFFEIYKELGYSEKEIPELILKNNLLMLYLYFEIRWYRLQFLGH